MKNKDCKPSHTCWQGFNRGECPLKRLENEKLFLGVLLTIAIGIILWSVV